MNGDKSMKKENDLNKQIEILNSIYNTKSNEIKFEQMTKIEDKLSDIFYGFEQIYSCLNILKLSLSSTEDSPTTESIEQFLDLLLESYKKELDKSFILKKDLI